MAESFVNPSPETLAKQAETRLLEQLAQEWGTTVQMTLEAQKLEEPLREKLLKRVAEIRAGAGRLVDQIATVRVAVHMGNERWRSASVSRNPVTPEERRIIAQLVARRHALGISQIEVDIRIGWASGLCGKFEAEHRRPSPRLLAEWAQSLGAVVLIAPAEEARVSA